MLNMSVMWLWLCTTSFKMADSVDDLFLWGDDFEEILGILKGDEDLDEQFMVEVTNFKYNCW